MADDNRPFNIQGQYGVDNQTDRAVKRCTVPWWLAEEAYAEYSRLYGTAQSLERLNERRGFGRGELLSLLRRERS